MSNTYGADLDNCGSNYIGSIKRAKSFIHNLKKSINDSKSFSKLFKLPIQFQFESGKTKTITSEKYLIQNFEALKQAGLKEFFLGLNLENAFCNYQGMALGAGLLWADADSENGIVKIKSLNLKLNDFKTDFDKEYKGIDKISKKGKVTFDKLAKKNGYNLPEWGEYEIYKADITNDGKEDYIITYINSGSGKYSGIEAIIEVQNNKFQIRKLDTYKISQMPVKNKRSKIWKEKLSSLKNIELKNFYSYLGKPFMYKDQGKVIVNFSDDGKINISYSFDSDYLVRIK